MQGSLGMYKNFQPTKASDITEEVIVSRMDEKMMKKVGQLQSQLLADIHVHKYEDIFILHYITL